MLKKLLKILMGLLIVLLLSVCGFIIGDYLYYSDRILPGYSIGNIDVSGLTTSEAISLLTSKSIDSILPSPMHLKYGKFDFEFTPSHIVSKLRIAEMAENAFGSSRGKNYLLHLPERIGGIKRKVPNQIEIDKNNLAFLIKLTEKEVASDPKSAYFEILKSGSVEVVPHQSGRQIDIEKTITLTEKVLKKGKADIPLQIIYLPPRIKTEDLTKYLPLYLMGHFRTYYGTHDSPNRIHNIALIASKLHNIVVKPNETFSLLDHIGEFSEEQGFKEAYVITKEGLEAQYGGGTCQIATTLFNSISYAGLQVIERKNHSMYFSIYPLGRDATVYPPYTDFKFINDSGYNIIIQARAGKKGLTFNILGIPTGKVVAFSAPEVHHYYAEVSDEATGEIKKIKLPPFRTQVVMTVKMGDKVIKEKVYKSYYKLNGDTDKVPIIKKEAH